MALNNVLGLDIICWPFGNVATLTPPPSPPPPMQPTYPLLRHCCHSFWFSFNTSCLSCLYGTAFCSTLSTPETMCVCEKHSHSIPSIMCITYIRYTYWKCFDDLFCKLMHKLNSIMKYNLSLFLIFSPHLFTCSLALASLFRLDSFSISMEKKKKKEKNEWLPPDRTLTHTMHTCVREATKNGLNQLYKNVFSNRLIAYFVLAFWCFPSSFFSFFPFLKVSATN